MAGAEADAAGLVRILGKLGQALWKGVLCIAAFIVLGRLCIRWLYNRVARFKDQDVFTAFTLLVVLVSAISTESAGLS